MPQQLLDWIERAAIIANWGHFTGQNGQDEAARAAGGAKIKCDEFYITRYIDAHTCKIWISPAP